MTDPSIHTAGGSAIGGNVDTGGGNFAGRDQITINVTWQAAPFTLPEPDLAQLRDDYLAYLREAYRYLDFKGLPQVEKIAQQLALDAVYVPLRARPDAPAGETWLRVAGRPLALAEGGALAEGAEDVAALLGAPRGGSPEPVAADVAIAAAPALVILGDPGAGKSTLLKMLALALARQEEGPLPILVPLNAYAAELARQELSLHAFLGRYFATRQHCLRDVGALFTAALKAGQAVVLLDGLDEVQAQRAFLVRLVQDFAAEYIPAAVAGETPPGNRLAATSRIVGYRDAPLNGDRWRTYTLVDWGRDEIARFADRWTLAFETAVHGAGDLAREAAGRECDDLLAAVFENPGIERLASNPLLLTILALIKRQGVSLPQRRVELYELYLRTLINAWNKARSLDQRPVGPELDYLETVQVLAPLGLWLRETNPTAGLVSRAALEEWLTAYYMDEWALARGPARQRGREFLDAVRRYSNLLIERGHEQYGFLHLTFEEMLAGKGIAARAQEGAGAAVAVILRYLDDPGWRETILLAVGALGVVTQQPQVAGSVLCALCDECLEGEACGRPVILAGAALLDVGEAGVGRKAAAQVTQRLVTTMQDAAVPIRTRRDAGLLLGRLGWQPDDLDAFVEVPAGKFLYGDEKEERELAQRYWMAKYPVTNRQYARFIEDHGYDRQALWSADGWDWRTGTYDSKAPKAYREWLARRPPEKRRQPRYWEDIRWNNPLFPVVGVTWFEAAAYCQWLEEQGRMANSEWRVWDPQQQRGIPFHPSSFILRLPSEAEWERAARGGDGWRFPWGAAEEMACLNCADAWAGKSLDDKDWNDWIQEGRFQSTATTAVCTYPQGVSSTGAWDMSGNVWEWTASPVDEIYMVVRGGSWFSSEAQGRCTYRRRDPPGYDGDYVGFRVNLSLVDSDS